MTPNSGGKGRRWTHVQATLLKSICTRAMMNTTAARMSAANPVIERELTADLVFFSVMKAEAEDALRRSKDNWARAA